MQPVLSAPTRIATLYLNRLPSPQGIWKWEGDNKSAEEVLETKGIATDAMVSQLAEVRVENSSGIKCIDSIEPEMELFTE